MDTAKKFYKFKNNAAFTVNFSRWIGETRHHYVNVAPDGTGTIEPGHSDWHYKISAVRDGGNKFLYEMREVSVNNVNKLVTLNTLADDSSVFCVTVA